MARVRLFGLQYYNYPCRIIKRREIAVQYKIPKLRAFFFKDLRHVDLHDKAFQDGQLRVTYLTLVFSSPLTVWVTLLKKNYLVFSTKVWSYLCSVKSHSGRKGIKRKLIFPLSFIIEAAALVHFIVRDTSGLPECVTIHFLRRPKQD